MKRILQVIGIVFLLFRQVQLFSDDPLSYKRIPLALNEIFTYHVECKALTPLLIKRSFNVFISHFDPHQTYLLRSEVTPYYTLTDQNLATILRDAEHGHFPEYIRLNKLMISSIQRARKIRATIRTQLLHKSDLDLTAFYPAKMAYPETQSQLYQSTFKMMHNWLAHYAAEKGVTTLDSPDRLKVFNYHEKKRRAHEDQYILTFERHEPAFALNILKSLAASLDANTMYYSASEAKAIRSMLFKKFCGVGLHLRESVEGSKVAHLIDNSPAARAAAIQVGDILRQIDGVSVDDLYFHEVLNRMEGEAGTKVTFLFERPATKERYSVTLHREFISLQNERIQVSSELFADGVIGKISMHAFYENDDGVSLEADVREALKELRSQGPIYGLILDVRNNAGGFLSQAIKTVGLFIKSGVVVIAKYAGDEIHYQRDVDPRQYYSGPLIVLTSKASASAAEILAASLQDEGVALVVGDERTYGKGTMQYQTVTDPNARDFYKVTVGRYYTVSGKSTQIDGVKADIVVPTPYSRYQIGERYRRYPLLPEHLLQKHNVREDVQKIFHSYQERRNLALKRYLPRLQQNSRFRLTHDQNFVAFRQALETQSAKNRRGLLMRQHGQDDLQMKEAVAIIKDLLLMQTSAS